MRGSKLLFKAGKVIDNVMGVAKKAEDAISGAVGKFMTKAKGLTSNFSPGDLAKS
ncbi:hypothetical protein [Paenibacillus silvae]|uniref:hypothetical protein n=1 Tax=Paenibacillus silvae TaxID=1325358 RepID=UPI0016433705|nr:MULTISPECIES: hypothetical protein [Paenibacillus]MCK6075299.1 hypothetical protein [Paenibacillus silvae]MCK6149686.1 hypothetical protein [Paenibacillus silvae]MCK6267984.1 hypothetical protein [Paenibacillus silvae]